MDQEFSILVSVIRCYRDILGYTINLIREITFCSVYFGLYEHLKNSLNKIGTEMFHNTNTASSISIIMAGGLSGVSGIVIK